MEKGAQVGEHSRAYEDVEKLIRGLDESAPLKAYMAVRKLISLVEREPEAVAEMCTLNSELHESLQRRLDRLIENSDPVLRAHVKELKARVDEISKCIEKPKGEGEPENLYERAYLSLRDASPFVVYKGLRLLSTLLEREPKTVLELSMNNPTLVEAIEEELQKHSVGKDGTIKVDAKRLLARMERLLEGPTEEEEEEVAERREHPPEAGEGGEALERILEKLAERPAPTPVVYTPPPSKTSTIVDKLLEGFASAKSLSVLFIAEGVLFFMITGFIYTAGFQASSINPLATIAFYCLIIGVVFRVLEDYYGEEKLEEAYERHTFVFNIAKLFLVLNALVFLFLVALR